MFFSVAVAFRVIKFSLRAFGEATKVLCQTVLNVDDSSWWLVSFPFKRCQKPLPNNNNNNKYCIGSIQTHERMVK